MNARLQTRQVLCVDDDVHVLSFLTDALQNEGFQVHTAVDGAHALQKMALREPRYDLIIADARMPELDGWRLIMQARAAGYRGKIIVFSGYMDEHERQRYRSLQVDRIIEKPPKRGELIDAIKGVLEIAA
ncbi:MAG TPA: response regulator [Chthoniobacterales bacterium]